MSDFEWVEVPDNSIIILRTENFPDWDEEEILDSRFKIFHEHYPTCLVMLLAGGDSLEVRPLEEVQILLEGLIAHKEALP
jgi:hypothetical protein